MSLVSKVIVDGSECEKVACSGSTAQYNEISLRDAFYGLWKEDTSSTYDIETEILLKDEWVENSGTYKIICQTKQLVTFNIKVNFNFENLILYDNNFDIYFYQCWNVWKKSNQCDNLMYYYDSKKLELRCFYANFADQSDLPYTTKTTFRLLKKINTTSPWEEGYGSPSGIDKVFPPHEIAFYNYDDEDVDYYTYTIDTDKEANFLTVAKTLNNTNNYLYHSYKISCKLTSYIYSKEDIPDEVVQDIRLLFYPKFNVSHFDYLLENGVLILPQEHTFSINNNNDGDDFTDCFCVNLKVVKLVNDYYCEFDTNITDDNFILNNGCVFFKHKGLFYLIKSVDLKNSFFSYYEVEGSVDDETYFFYQYYYVSHNTNSIFVRKRSSSDNRIGDSFNIDFSNSTLSVLINNISLINNRENCLHESHIYVN